MIKEIIKKRQSIRKYKPKEISKKIIDDLIDVARLSPSSKNTQPWKFKIVDDEKTKELLRKENVFKQDFVYSAPVILVCCSDLKAYDEKRNKKYKKAKKKWALIDLSIACYGLVLRATELGLGSCFIGLMEEKKMKKILGIPKNYIIPYSIVLGYPEKDDEQIVMDRKNIGEIIL